MMSRSMKYMRHKKQETALRHDRCIANNAKKKFQQHLLWEFCSCMALREFLCIVIYYVGRNEPKHQRWILKIC